MEKPNLIAIALVLCIIPTYKCFAPHSGKKKAADQQQSKATKKLAREQAPQQTVAAPAPIALKETQAFKYLHESLPEASASWITWSKTGIILKLLRQKQMQATLASPAYRTRTEHDLDWAIRECMNPSYNGQLLEMYTRCAEQDVTINESSLQAVYEYSGQEMERELLALKKVQNETFTRIKKMKALRQLIKHMRAQVPQDEGSDVDDYDDQHIFEKTKIIVQPESVAPAAAPSAADASDALNAQ